MPRSLERCSRTSHLTPVGTLLAACYSEEPSVPVTVLMNRHGLALRYGIFFFSLSFFCTSAAFKSFMKNSLRQCQVVVLPHSWLLKCLSFTQTFTTWKPKRAFLTILYLCWVLAFVARRFRHNSTQCTKACLCAVKALSADSAAFRTKCIWVQRLAAEKKFRVAVWSSLWRWRNWKQKADHDTNVESKHSGIPADQL